MIETDRLVGPAGMRQDEVLDRTIRQLRVVALGVKSFRKP